jgi:hypothetical protein
MPTSFPIGTSSRTHTETSVQFSNQKRTVIQHNPSSAASPPKTSHGIIISQNNKTTKPRGSIPKPSANNPLLITTSDEKIAGKSDHFAFDLTAPPLPYIDETLSKSATFERLHLINLPQVEEILPHIQPCPVPISTSPAWIIPLIYEICSTTGHSLPASPFTFAITTEAASHNMSVIQRHNNNISNVLDAHQHTFLKYGSEFRPIRTLEKLLMHHHRWPKFKSIIENGSSWPLTEIADDTRQAKNEELLKRGNHKSAISYAEELSNILVKEVGQGWMIPIPTTYICNLHNAEVAPVGITQQWQAYEDGSRAPKFRLTHDQSFEASIGQSVNNRVEKEKLDELYYGHSLNRLIHYIVSLRLQYPTTKILIAKTDFKGAYRRVSLNGDTAARCIITMGDIALLSLRLTFGGTPCPNEFCIISEICADLANDILHSDNWDPTTLHSPHTISLPLEKDSSEHSPFTPGKDLDVYLFPDPRGKVEIYIDDGITVIPDINDNRLRGTNAMALAIHTICRPISPDEPIKRDDCLSLSKLSEEGTLAESATVLGWRINTRSLTISIPPDKYNSWRMDIEKILTKKKASHEEIETLIGRLNHASNILPIARYFLNRIRLSITPSATQPNSYHMKKHTIWLPKPALSDLALFQETFLPKMYKGISLNLITYRRPTHILFSDACPKGMGGYSVNTGLAWRWKIPPDLVESVALRNNLLEFMAALTTIWIETEQESTPALSCILALGDNSSAVGWLHKANVDPNQNKALHTASRKLASLLMESECCLYSQHFKGEFNNVADALSRLHDLTDNQLLSFILSNFPDQVPHTFSIVPLAPSIISWMTWLLQKNNGHTEFKNKQQTKKRGRGNDGYSTLTESRTDTIPSSSSSSPSCELDCLVPSALPSVKGSFLNKVRASWVEAQSKRPWQNWVRSSGQTWGQTPTMDQITKQSILY